MLVVLVVIGLAMGLVIARGPQRSATVELRGAAADVARTLRGARGQAIASDRSVLVAVDPARHAIGVDGGTARVLPRQISLVVAGGVTSVAKSGQRVGGIRFAPDGSASGGTIELANPQQRIDVAVEWLTGRVSLRNVPRG